MSAGTDRQDAVRRGITIGAVGGIIAGMMMAGYAMIISATVKDVGFFTPLYHIASSLISPKAMMTSMAQAGHGHEFTFTLGPAIVGLMVHMMTGAMAGAVFGAAVAGRHLARPVTAMAGGAFGLLVLVVNSFVGLPIVASLFGGGDAITHMAKMVGWGTFTVEHLIFGLVLGMVVAATSVVAGRTSTSHGVRAHSA